MKKVLILVGGILIGAVIICGLLFIPKVNNWFNKTKDQIVDKVENNKTTQDTEDTTDNEQTEETSTPAQTPENVVNTAFKNFIKG